MNILQKTFDNMALIDQKLNVFFIIILMSLYNNTRGSAGKNYTRQFNNDINNV